MERANKAMRQRIGRIGRNFFSEKKDELQSVSGIDQRNQKIISAIHTYKKNIAASIKTGLREESAEKRKKKCDEFTLAADLMTDSKELEMQGSTCLAKVLRNMQAALNSIMEEKVQSEVMVEKRVLDGLNRYIDMDKALTKSKERLNNTIVDVEISKKQLHAKQHDENKAADVQDEYDANMLKLESLKDNTITDIFTLASKEQDIALVCSAYLEEQLEFYRFAMRTLESALPEIRRNIANARPRPMFGVDLEEHLRHAGRNISVVLEKCCHILRMNGLQERGLFRVNGNNTKIRRMKAAFDAGHIDDEVDTFIMDAHSVCSVLKCYLRELPDPLLTNRLHADWVAATKVEGEDRLQYVEHCLSQLPPAYYQNLAYLMSFLNELLQYEKITMMNAGNLAIVFGPNLVGNGNETDNVTGSKIVETLLLNYSRFFGRSNGTHSSSSSSSANAASAETSPVASSLGRTNSTPYGGRPGRKNGAYMVDCVNMVQEIIGPNQQLPMIPIPPERPPKPVEPIVLSDLEERYPTDASLTIDTHGSLRASTKSLSVSPMESSFTNSPRSNRRPKVVAPLPPQQHSTPLQQNTAASTATPVTLASIRNEANRTVNNDIPNDENYGGFRGNLVDFEHEVASGGPLNSRTSSNDSMNDYDNESIDRSLDRPTRPPPPSFRQPSMNSKARPISYNIAVGASSPVENAEQTSLRASSDSERTTQSDSPDPVPPPRSSDPTQHRSIVTVYDSGSIGSATSLSSASNRPRPPLPVKPAKVGEAFEKPKEMTKL